VRFGDSSLVFLPRCDAGKPLRGGKSPSGSAISGAIPDPRGDESTVGTRRSGSPPVRAPRRARADVGGTRARNPQPAGRDQRIGGNAHPKAAGCLSSGKRTRGIHLLGGEPCKRSGSKISGFRAPPAT